MGPAIDIKAQVWRVVLASIARVPQFTFARSIDAMSMVATTDEFSNASVVVLASIAGGPTVAYARSGGGTATTVVATIDAKAEIIVLTPVARVRAALTHARPIKAPPVLTAGASYVHTSARIEVVAMIIVGGDTLRNGRHRNYDHTSTIRLGSNIHAPLLGERQYMIHEVHNQHRDNGRSTRTFCRNSRSRTRS